MDSVFFFFSKTIPALLYPLPLVLILVGVFGARQRRWKQRLPFLLPAGLLWILSTPAVLNLAAGIWEAPLAQRRDLEGKIYDAAVVLGGLSLPELSSKEYTEFSGRSERLLVPLELYREGRVKKILITSGSGSLLNQTDREADALEAFALRWGVLREDLLIERESRNTYENALFSGKILDEKGLNNLLLVTSAFHMKRSAAIFSRQGFRFSTYSVDTLKDPTPFPMNLIPDPQALGNLQVLLKEFAGYTVYGIMGYL